MRSIAIKSAPGEENEGKAHPEGLAASCACPEGIPSPRQIRIPPLYRSGGEVVCHCREHDGARDFNDVFVGADSRAGWHGSHSRLGDECANNRKVSVSFFKNLRARIAVGALHRILLPEPFGKHIKPFSWTPRLNVRNSTHIVPHNLRLSRGEVAPQHCWPSNP